jgi:N utilization substance protein B
MSVRSRRKAREAALRVLYEVEFGRISAADALLATLEEGQLASELREFATQLVNGVLGELKGLDSMLAPLITDYAYDRVAAVDRNVMRIAAFELFHMPGVPPAVTLNEAVEIAKKYSTADSGKFVNGVLGTLLASSPKANWDPAAAPSEIEEVGEMNVPLEVEIVEVDEAEARKLLKVGGWTVRTEELQ